MSSFIVAPAIARCAPALGVPLASVEGLRAGASAAAAASCNWGTSRRQPVVGRLPLQHACGALVRTRRYRLGPYLLVPCCVLGQDLGSINPLASSFLGATNLNGGAEGPGRRLQRAGPAEAVPTREAARPRRDAGHGLRGAEGRRGPAGAGAPAARAAPPSAPRGS